MNWQVPVQGLMADKFRTFRGNFFKNLPRQKASNDVLNRPRNPVIGKAGVGAICCSLLQEGKVRDRVELTAQRLSAFQTVYASSEASAVNSK